MFLYLLVLLVAGIAVHVVVAGARTARRIGTIALLWLVVGYCGLPMLAVSALALAHPAEAARMLGFPPGNPFQSFAMVAYLALSLLSVLTLRYRGAYLVGPAVAWAVFFAGATVIHLGDAGAHGGISHGGALVIFATHGLISVLLMAALIASGVWRRDGGGEARGC